VTRWPARLQSSTTTAPEALVRFVASEWPGDVWQAFAAWKQARHAWHAEHVLPGRVGPWGDGIDMLLAEREARRRLPLG
jgi:hypothetical protein